jgi:hypothetical protein
LLNAKISVRRWDDLAKNPDLKVPPLEAYKELAYQCLLGRLDSDFLSKHAAGN